MIRARSRNLYLEGNAKTGYYVSDDDSIWDILRVKNGRRFRLMTYGEAILYAWNFVCSVEPSIYRTVVDHST